MTRTCVQILGAHRMLSILTLFRAASVCSASFLRAQALQEVVPDSSGRCARPVEQIQRALERKGHAVDESMLRQKVANDAAMWPFSSGHRKNNKADKAEKGEADAADAPSSKVEIGLYYEVLCPYCKRLMNVSVAPLWNDPEFKKRIDVKFYPYGNAMSLHKDTVSDGYKFWHEELNASGFDYVFACQHGSEECFGNTLQNCAMETLKKPNKYVPFILCMESYREEASLELASFDCASRLHVDMLPIRDCTRGKQGNKVMLQIGEETERLDPPHEYVPWVTLNGKHSEASEADAEKGEGNLLREVCDRLSEPKPKLCPI